jgi:hypothetical protein
MRPPWWAHKFFRTFTVFLLLALLFGNGGAVPSGNGKAVVSQAYTVFVPMTLKQMVPPLPHTPPRPSTSYYFYMWGYTQAKARNLGCQLGTEDFNTPGTQESLVILDFGLPKLKDGVYGASGMKLGGFYTMNQIADAVQQFGIGYWDCADSDYTSKVHIGIGTNNYNKPDDRYYTNLAVNYGHGRAWALLVNQVNDWFRNVCPDKCNGQVDAMGANDIELAWSSYAAIKDWLNGYDSVNEYNLINFGAAEGCPNACGGGGFYWTKDQVLQVTNSAMIYSLPEIYLNSGTNARQWYQLSLYSVQKYGYPFDFAGTLTTHGACLQEPDDELCPYIDNTPQEGWTQLYNLVNGSNSSTYDDLTYSSDILWTD